MFWTQTSREWLKMSWGDVCDEQCEGVLICTLIIHSVGFHPFRGHPARQMSGKPLRKQKKVWRYVEEGSLLKLKSYLRKHKDVDVNFSQGKRQRSPLHLACSQGDDAMLRLLLKHGADSLGTERNGDTPLHLAAKRALKYGKRGKISQAHTYTSCTDLCWKRNIS